MLPYFELALPWKYKPKKLQNKPSKKPQARFVQF